MILGDLIKYLKAQPQQLVLAEGFGQPHSYRMDYSQLAFRPAANVSIASMLSFAEQANGATYEGWKGGEYEMDLNTECFIAEWGDPGQPVDSIVIRRLEAEIADLNEQLVEPEARGFMRGWEACRRQLIQSGVIKEGQP